LYVLNVKITPIKVSQRYLYVFKFGISRKNYASGYDSHLRTKSKQKKGATIEECLPFRIQTYVYIYTSQGE
jgi:hypothetical protein